MIDDNKIDEFLMHWRFINRHLREGKLSHGDKKITRLQWTLLRHVSRTDQCTMGSLAEHFNVSMSTVSQMIDRLENWGYVQRGSSARDARVKIVSLTEKGEAIIEDVTAAYLKLLNNGLSSFSSNEQDQFIGFLKRLAEEIKRGQSPLDSNTPSNP
ncbi:MarR family transcriptional regulator [Pullulanibacillus sp. KACC 23026]|uniref:MarR family winged helix-turn-helix transcriptional regulator n=1 Tax=Pullulanibacillus sp. KACC 23026 TaxID=3028315 RepID=UPI0023AEF409|nr:MarR family transcriptional regulator [Pullulanibacillus sp. KACC 23026]WEG14656.1 MarR family transcriptional regulator [Pullulanibacillus sp. KACC 23026]